MLKTCSFTFISSIWIDFYLSISRVFLLFFFSFDLSLPLLLTLTADHKMWNDGKTTPFGKNGMEMYVLCPASDMIDSSLKLSYYFLSIWLHIVLWIVNVCVYLLLHVSFSQNKKKKNHNTENDGQAILRWLKWIILTSIFKQKTEGFVDLFLLYIYKNMDTRC